MVCWSSLPITSEEELMQKLGYLPWNKEGEEGVKSVSNSYRYPLEIQQHTQLCVLHRKSSDYERDTLSLPACRIEDHWFRLECPRHRHRCQRICPWWLWQNIYEHSFVAGRSNGYSYYRVGLQRNFSLIPLHKCFIYSSKDKSSRVSFSRGETTSLFM